MVRVLSLGNIESAINPVIDDHTPFTGATELNANILAKYIVAGNERLLPAKADVEGKFLIVTPEIIPIGTSVEFFINVPFLITSTTMISRSAGELILQNAPDEITFIMEKVSEIPLLLARKVADAPVSVYDSRVYSTKWQLVVSLDGPFKTEAGDVLPEAIVFVDDKGLVSLGTDPLIVYTGEPNEGPFPHITDVKWDGDKGILLHVTEPLINKEKYSAHISWDIRVI